MNQPSVHPDRRRAWIIAGGHLLLGFFFLSPGYIRPDSVAVYSWLRSAVFDRDLLFFNEWQGFGMIANHATTFKEVTALGTLANHWPIGTSIAALPAYLVALIVNTLIGGRGDGFFGLYSATLGWSATAYTAASLILMDRLLGRNAIRNVLVAGAVLLGTPLFWYTFRYPLGTHAAGVLAVTILVWLLLREDAPPDGYLLGLALGFATTVRLQHIVLLAAVLLFGVLRRATTGFYIRCAAGFSVVALTQALAWWIIYGSPLGPLTSGANLGGVTYIAFHSLRFVPVLLSSYHGLIIWSPLTLFGVLGLLLSLRTRRNEAMILLLVFAAELFANATLDRFFWGGLSFGARRFVDLAAVFGVGVSWFLQLGRPRWLTASLVTLSVAWSALLGFAGMTGHLELARYVSAGDISRALIEAVGAGQIALRSPVVEHALLWHSLVAIAILALIAAGVWLCRGVVAGASTGYLLLCSLALVALWKPTRLQARTEMTRFGINPAVAARWGPLNDQHRLLRDEAEFLRATGDTEQARKTELEIARIEQALRDLNIDKTTP